LQLQPNEEKNTPEAIFQVPCGSFGEGLTFRQAMMKFSVWQQKRWARDHSAAFQQIRDVVQGWVNEDGTHPRRSAAE